MERSNDNSIAFKGVDIVAPGGICCASDLNVTIKAGAVITGPCWISQGSTLSEQAVVKANTVIGPVCKIGGEVSNTVVHSFSNKALIENSVYYNHKLEDKNMDAYARLFNINDKNIKNDGVKFTYSAYNQEDSDEQYIFLDNNNNKEIRASNAKKLSLIN